MKKLDPKSTEILIVGLGLLGGCYARALTEKGFTVRAITLEQSSIDYAVSHGFLAGGSTEVDAELIARSDLIVFALYPHIFVEWVEQYQHLISPGTVLTDVTGVKGNVVGKIQGMLRPDVEFIAAHPMAGREVSGVENSDPKIFCGANYIVVPTEKNTEDAIRLCEELGELLGFARVSRLSPEEHDRMIAFLSQLTHCIAVTLMCCNDEPGLEKYTGDSFRDLTRIARINDAMWSELFMENRDLLLDQMDIFIDRFIELRNFLAGGHVEDMRAMMRHSTERRARFDKPKE
ncbi:MAG: prephenate dehydrogenase [Clostridia bacterium]|nr:prephenate dehydrogenase [Clostridia bacterium]